MTRRDLETFSQGIGGLANSAVQYIQRRQAMEQEAARRRSFMSMYQSQFNANPDLQKKLGVTPDVLMEAFRGNEDQGLNFLASQGKPRTPIHFTSGDKSMLLDPETYTPLLVGQPKEETPTVARNIRDLVRANGFDPDSPEGAREAWKLNLEYAGAQAGAAAGGRDPYAQKEAERRQAAEIDKEKRMTSRETDLRHAEYDADWKSAPADVQSLRSVLNATYGRQRIEVLDALRKRLEKLRQSVVKINAIQKARGLKEYDPDKAVMDALGVKNRQEMDSVLSDAPPAKEEKPKPTSSLYHPTIGPYTIERG